MYILSIWYSKKQTNIIQRLHYCLFQILKNSTLLNSRLPPVLKPIHFILMSNEVIFKLAHPANLQNLAIIYHV